MSRTMKTKLCFLLAICLSSAAMAIPDKFVECNNCSSSQYKLAAEDATHITSMVYVFDVSRDQLMRYEVDVEREGGTVFKMAFPSPVEFSVKYEWDNLMDIYHAFKAGGAYEVPPNLGGSAYDVINNSNIHDDLFQVMARERDLFPGEIHPPEFLASVNRRLPPVSSHVTFRFADGSSIKYKVVAIDIGDETLRLEVVSAQDAGGNAIHTAQNSDLYTGDAGITFSGYQLGNYLIELGFEVNFPQGWFPGARCTWYCGASCTLMCPQL